MQFTDDPLVKESLGFLMTREIAHFQMFSAALASIEPNFPPGVLQGDPRYTHVYFNMSDGYKVRGKWNEGQGPWPEGEQWVAVEDPHSHVRATQGLKKQDILGSSKSVSEVKSLDQELSEMRSEEVKEATPEGGSQWFGYSPGSNGGSEMVAAGTRVPETGADRKRNDDIGQSKKKR